MDSKIWPVPAASRPASVSVRGLSAPAGVASPGVSASVNRARNSHASAAPSISWFCGPTIVSTAAERRRVGLGMACPPPIITSRRTLGKFSAAQRRDSTTDPSLGSRSGRLVVSGSMPARPFCSSHRFSVTSAERTKVPEVATSPPSNGISGSAVPSVSMIGMGSLGIRHSLPTG